MKNIIKDWKSLSVPVDKFDFSKDNVVKVSDDLLDILEGNKNLAGISANQIGYNKAVFAMSSVEGIICFNPKIVHYSNGKDIETEGSPSFPGLFVKVKRSSSVKVRYQDIKGEFKTSTWYGLTARIAQHHIDFLNGVLYYNRASRFHRERGFNKIKDKKELREFAK